MTAPDSPAAPAGGRILRPPGRSDLLALALLAAAAVLWLLPEPLAPLLVWPDAWTLPATDWIGAGATAVIEAVRPAARQAGHLLGHAKDAVGWLLTGAPWLAVMGVFIGAGWWIGGPRLAAVTTVTLLFVLLSGYWGKSMNTLTLVMISVPLALALGMVIGIAAYRMPRLRGVLEAGLDFMQTVPTFAYLTPLLLLFGFGPVVGLIASAIYAAPPIARNTLLGLLLVDAEIKEAGVMAGTTRLQRLWYVELPAALHQIMIGVNQCVMACLSMVIIAAVIGGFDDIGWEVLLTMRKAQFGDALVAGFVIVAFAIMIDRLSAGLAVEGRRGAPRVAVAIAGAGIGLGAATAWLLPDTTDLGVMTPVAAAIDDTLGRVTAAYGQQFDGLKNGAMFYGLLPLRIGLDDAVLDFTWGFGWTAGHTTGVLAVAAVPAVLLLLAGRYQAGAAVLLAVAVVLTGVTDLPWALVLAGVTGVAWRAGGWRLALFAGLALLAILVAGLWDRAMLSVYLCGAAVVACAVVGGGLGLLAALRPWLWRVVLQPVCDTLQTIPLFVFLIPVLMFFQIGEFSAFLAICAYAVVPMIRYTRFGVTATPDRLIEAARANGASTRQILVEVRLPYAVPAMLLGLNQTILYAFAMLVIAALVGTTGLGQAIYLALGQSDVGLGLGAGAAMAVLALIADRTVQALATARKRAMGL